MLLEKVSENLFSVTVCNDGNGLLFHPRSAGRTRVSSALSDPPTLLYKLGLTVSEVPTTNLVDGTLWYLILKPAVCGGNNQLSTHVLSVGLAIPTPQCQASVRKCVARLELQAFVCDHRRKPCRLQHQLVVEGIVQLVGLIHGSLHPRCSRSHSLLSET